MRILDQDNDKALKNVTLYLTLDEAREMLGDLRQLIENFGRNDHTHINDQQYEHEITLVLYSDKDLEGFNKRSKVLITDDV